MSLWIGQSDKEIQNYVDWVVAQYGWQEAYIIPLLSKDIRNTDRYKWWVQNGRPNKKIEQVDTTLSQYPLSKYPNQPFQLGEGWVWNKVTTDPETGAILSDPYWTQVNSGPSGTTSTTTNDFGLDGTSVEDINGFTFIVTRDSSGAITGMEPVGQSSTGGMSAYEQAQIDLQKQQYLANLQANPSNWIQAYFANQVNPYTKQLENLEDSKWTPANSYEAQYGPAWSMDTFLRDGDNKPVINPGANQFGVNNNVATNRTNLGASAAGQKYWWEANNPGKNFWDDYWSQYYGGEDNTAKTSWVSDMYGVTPETLQTQSQAYWESQDLEQNIKNIQAEIDQLVGDSIALGTYDSSEVQYKLQILYSNLETFQSTLDEINAALTQPDTTGLEEAEKNWTPSAPNAPSWLSEFVSGQAAGRPITKNGELDINLQKWNSAPQGMREMLGGYMQYANKAGQPQNLSEVNELVGNMLPKLRAGFTWKPAKQFSGGF